MPDSLYDRDILIWSEQQAEQLRRLAAGERPNVPVDWENVIEELESVGRSELSACGSLLQQAMIHLLKIALAPDDRAVRHWKGEIVGFLDRATRTFSPSMRPRLDLAYEYRVALRVVRAERDATSLPNDCPYTLDDLLMDEPDIDALVARVPVP